MCYYVNVLMANRITINNGLVVKALNPQSRGLSLKTKVNSAFHPSEVNKMSTRT